MKLILDTKSNNESAAPDYVGFWIRFVAFIIDNILGMILILLIVMPIIDLDKIADQDYLEDLQVRLNWMSLGFIALIIVFWKYLASTPGKLLFKAYICDEDGVTKASTKQLTIRAIAYIPSFLIFGLGFLWVAFDKKKQAWHDKISKTVVVHQKPK